MTPPPVAPPSVAPPPGGPAPVGPGASPLDRPPPAGAARAPDDFPEVGVDALATMGQRTIGMLVDLVPFQMALIVLVGLYGGGSSTDPLAGVPWWLSPAVNASFLVYQVGMLTWRGRTVGCVVARIRVAGYYDGARPRFHQAAVRSLIPMAAGSAFDVVGAPELSLLCELTIYLSAFADPLRRALHDKAAGTIVVRTA